MRFNNTPVQRDESIDIAKLFSKFSKYWKYNISIVITCFLVALAYILITPSQYEIKSNLRLISEKSGMSSELKMLKSTGLGSILGGSTSGINADDEVLTIKSKAILENVIRELGLQVDIKQRDGLKMVSAYKKAPLSLEFPTNFLDTLSKPILISVSTNNQKTSIKIESTLFSKISIENISLPYTIQTVIGNIKVDKTCYYKQKVQEKLKIKVSPLIEVYESYFKELNIGTADAASDIVKFSIDDDNKKRGIDILNTTMSTYNDYTKSVKIMESSVNASFVKEKLAIVTLELDSIENKIELYKKQNSIPDLTAYGSVVYMGAEESEKKILEMQTQLKLMEYVSNYLKDSNNKYAIVPNVVYEGEAVTKAYNSLMIERIRLLKSTEPSNPAIILVNDQLKEQRNALIETINSTIKTLKIAISEINKKNSSLNSQLNELPAREKEFIELKRLQKVKESLYLFLLQKLEEKEIANSPDEMAAHIVDKAYSSFKPVFPKKIIVLPVALIASIILSIIVISIKIFIIKKTASKDDLYENISYPVWGKFSDYESFKILRNLIYSKEQQNNIFMVTSNVEGEGKTFFANSLAKSLSITDKKVVLLNMNFSKNLDERINETTINNYINGNIDINKIIEKESPNLYIIHATHNQQDCGMLIYNKKMKELIDYLKTNYDYVIIDTSSLAASSSAFDIAHFADYTFFIFREDYTPKNKLKNINNIIESSLLPNVCVVINSNITK